MQLYRLGTISDKRAALKQLGVESGGVRIISKKMELYFFMIHDLRTPAANILKQDALSIGAELAVPSGVITCEKESFDCLLIANQKQLEILSQKELSQPFGLKKVAQTLQTFLTPSQYPTRIMGVLNANEDSFYSGSRFIARDAIDRIKEMIAQGADMIDIGAVSSRPGAERVGEHIELSRIQPICDAIQSEKLYEHVLFSIDSYTPSVISYALERGFGLVNDITGASDEAIIKLTQKHQAKLCIMHMQGTPQTMQSHPSYQNVVIEVNQFFEERIARCEALGVSREQIILDVGIGFGKTLAHNIALIQNLKHFQHFGCELLIGASRKSMIDHIIPTPVEERLPGTLAIHLKALEQGVDIIRCHDVIEHQQAITVFEKLK